MLLYKGEDEEHRYMHISTCTHPMKRNFARRFAAYSLLLLIALVVCACGGGAAIKPPTTQNGTGEDIAIFALGLIDTQYVFGGKNPEAGLDCSGLVQFTYAHAANRHLTGNAAELFRQGTSIPIQELAAGDLLFFKSSRRQLHVAIYIGNREFIHAPSSRGKVRREKLDNPWFIKKYAGARRLLL